MVENITVLKVDLDLEDKETAVEQLKTRLFFLDRVGILEKGRILRVKLVKKVKYSAKIYCYGELINDYAKLVIQGILGDDWKRQAICLRDIAMGKENWNRLFDIKIYDTDYNYKVAKDYDVTKEILDYLGA